jgi:predicted  nucleic acid-binding Zn-ribbon protein
MEKCEDCEQYAAEIVKLKETIAELEDRVSELEKVIDSEVACIRAACHEMLEKL